MIRRMTVRLLSRVAIPSLIRVAGTGIAAMIGAWDVLRLLSAGNREPRPWDLITCPLVPALRLLNGTVFANISDDALAWILVLGNAATYGAVACGGLLLLVERRAAR
jgi:hypothetical protein